MLKYYTIALFICLGAGLTGGSLLHAAAPMSSAQDEAAVVALYDAYHTTWMPNDSSVPNAVMQLFADDGAILPHHGDPIVAGRKNIRNHWFPDNQIGGTVDRFTHTVERVEVAESLGYIYGRFSLAYTYEGTVTTFDGNQLMIARKESDGWKIVAVMWNDPPQ